MSSKLTISDDSYSTLPPNLFKFYQPQFTTKYASLCMLIFGLLLITMGTIVYLMQPTSDIIEYDYTFCHDIITHKRCQDITSKNYQAKCVCEVNLKSIKTNYYLKNPHVYYRLNNFYQNARFYSDSYDKKQLQGILDTKYNDCPKISPKGKTVFPCGLIAKSLFNDTIIFQSNNQNINLIRNPYYHEQRFINPKKKPLSSNFDGFIKPDSWSKYIYELDNNDPNNNGLRNYNFMTWMTIYPFQNTLKYLGKWPSDELNSINDDIKITIHYNYNVESFSGKKTIIIAQIGHFGIKNMFLSFLYFTMGSVLLAFSLMFFIYYRIYVMSHDDYPLDSSNVRFDSGFPSNTA